MLRVGRLHFPVGDVFLAAIDNCGLRVVTHGMMVCAGWRKARRRRASREGGTDRCSMPVQTLLNCHSRGPSAPPPPNNVMQLQLQLRQTRNLLNAETTRSMYRGSPELNFGFRWNKHAYTAENIYFHYIGRQQKGPYLLPALCPLDNHKFDIYNF